ncbi:hypothetical protein GGQ64_002508 [Rhizobium azooxidifex]|uniref:Uncharacterized protein n=1 Tax=Mycoplana azooxidifex TaxID=1636188 RepID=A0A7W6D764_9HYPH|nr:hypothetical protein [Mycoplana azooxidifex]
MTWAVGNRKSQLRGGFGAISERGQGLDHNIID